MSTLTRLLGVAALVLALSPMGMAQSADLAGPVNQRATLALPSFTTTPLQAPPLLRGAAVLYDNGPLVTSPGTGTGGADESVLQNVSLGQTSLGAGHASGASFSVADEFTVPAGATWDIDAMVFYAYQTNSPTTSSITDYSVQIYDGDPSAGGAVIFGDLTTNVLASTTWSSIYRVAENSLGSTARPIMETTVTTDVTLTGGTYWVEWTTVGSLASGPWAPPITIAGQAVTGNALQNDDTGAWNSILDGGTLDALGLPFLIIGSDAGTGGDTIADARAGVGTEVTISGVVTRARGAFTYLQDATGGITIRQTSGAFFDDVADGDIAPGTQVTITGTTSEFNGLFQINGGDFASYSIDGTTDVPDAQVVTLDQLMSSGEMFEGELVSVVGLSTADMGIFMSSTNYDVTDASGMGVLRVVGSNDSELDDTDIPEAGFTFEGVVGQFNGGAGDTGYQLLGIDATDVTADAPPPAGTVAEDGDAPLLLDGTQDASGETTMITGEITADDLADCYSIDIADIDAFSATTANTIPNSIDSQLYLFETDGTAIAFNDDTVGGSGDFLSTLPAGFLTGLGYEAGSYVLCVAEFDTDPQNAAGEDIYNEGNGRTVHFPSAPNGDFLLAAWVPSFVTPGVYQVDLTGTGDGPPPPDGDISLSSEVRNSTDVPSGGGFVRFTLEIANDGDGSENVDIWAAVTMPGETVPFFVRSPRTFTVPANTMIRTRYNQRIPDYVPAGMYTLTMIAGVYNDGDPANPTTVYSMDSYVITKGDVTALRAFEATLKEGLDVNGLKWLLAQETQMMDKAASADPSAWLDSEFDNIETVQLGRDQAAMATLADGTIQVGPNPVRQQARFTFSLEQDARVTLAVFDLLGREVSTLTDGALTVGSHTAVFDASSVPAGTYVYRLTVDGEVQTGRMTVVR